jgi:hypothetical protein
MDVSPFAWGDRQLTEGTVKGGGLKHLFTPSIHFYMADLKIPSP